MQLCLFTLLFLSERTLQYPVFVVVVVCLLVFRFCFCFVAVLLSEDGWMCIII